MPSSQVFTYISLDEGIDYFNDYFQKVNPLKDISFLLSLTEFIGLGDHSNIIDNLKPYEYIIDVRKGDSYRLVFYKNSDDTNNTLTLKQIEELQKFNNILRNEEAKNTLNAYYNRNKKIFFSIVILLVSVYVWWKFIR